MSKKLITNCFGDEAQCHRSGLPNSGEFCVAALANQGHIFCNLLVLQLAYTIHIDNSRVFVDSLASRVATVECIQP